jgi:hypothetical protein
MIFDELFRYTCFRLHLSVYRIISQLFFFTSLFAVALPAIGGLGWTSPDLAISLALMGVVQLFAQFVLYPMVNSRISTMALYRWSLILYIPLYMACPVISHYGDVWGEDGARLVWYLMLCTLTVRFTLSTFSYTAVMLMVSGSQHKELWIH